MTQKKRRMWGGFVDGELAFSMPDERREVRWAYPMSIYRKRSAARSDYSDVRPVLVSWSSTPPKRKRKAK